MKSLTHAIDQPPSSPDGVAFTGWLRELERSGHGWDDLFDALMSLSDQVAAGFGDVMPPHEVYDECARLSYDRWVPDWLDGVRVGTEARSFAMFVGDRLRDLLRAMRRTSRRRAEKRRVEIDPTALNGTVTAPDERARQQALIEEFYAHEDARPFDREVLPMLLLGYEQKEIARVTGKSEPTISRSCERVRTILLSLVTT